MSDGRTRIPLPAPSRHKTRYPGVCYRLDAKGNRRYQIIYRDSNGKRVFKTVDGNEKDALRQRNEILERMHRGGKVVNSKLTVKELAENYLRTQTSHLKPRTRAAYGYSLDHYILPRIGHRKASEMGVDNLVDLIAELQQFYAAGTIRGCLTPLSRMFTYAIRKGWATNNPVTDLDRNERPKGSGRQMRILSTDEIQQVLAAASAGVPITQKGKPTARSLEGTYKPLLMTAIFAGLRRGELLELQWEDVDLLAGEIHVRTSKTEAGVRAVVIPDFLVQELAAQMGTEGRVFPFGARNVNRALAETLARAGVPHCRFHDLRHTYASILVGQGLDVTYVADQLGHANPRITLGIYAKLFEPKARKKEAREKLQESFKGVVA